MRDFRIEDETDNGEFITTATAVLLQDGVEVHREKFVASSEDAPVGEPSAYWNGKSNHATTLALSYAWGFVEAENYSTDEPSVQDLVDHDSVRFPPKGEPHPLAGMPPLKRTTPICDRCGRELGTGLPTPCRDCTA